MARESSDAISAIQSDAVQSARPADHGTPAALARILKATRATDARSARRRWFAGHIAFLVTFLGLWELASARDWLDQTFFGRPSGIARYIYEGYFGHGKLWKHTAYTIGGTLIAFVLGSIAAVLTAMLFVMAPKVERATEPYLLVLNAMPRIALAPLFLLWFGLGIWSKVAVAFSLTFFIVLSSTIAGVRGVNPDHVTLARTLGATPKQLFLSITLPSAVPVMFSGLRLGLIYAMLGVIGAELIAAEHGLGQMLAYLQATFNMDGVMGILVLLSILGMLVTRGMTKLEQRLLKWR
jgi:NitT/TauT family transport system permease protein